MKTIKQFTIFILLISVIASGCETMNRSQKGAAIGTAGGAVIGAIIGKVAGNTAIGAVAGAAVGGVTGTIIGRKMDKQAEEMKKVLGDSAVRREGEGIVLMFNDKVLFGYDRSDLSPAASTSLNKLVEILQKYPDTDIDIIGHTDAKGADDYNQKLSERRAASVATYLIGKGGISSSRLTTKGMGKRDPVATNDTEDGRAQNRRVEFVITANEKMKADAQREAGQQ